MTEKVVPFPLGKGKRKPLPLKDVDTVAFQTVDDRHLYIVDREQIAKIMRFLIKEKIQILEDKHV